MQARHAPPFSPVYPALQTQSSIVSLPAGEWELAGHTEHAVPAVLFTQRPASHSIQASDPVELLYVPVSHALHSPSAAVYPALQAHVKLPSVFVHMASAWQGSPPYVM
eukprot:3496116-Rhodomonas_salina.1